MTVAVIDSGGANLASVVHALGRLGVEAILTRDADVIRQAERVILPGVGAAAPAMESLRSAGLTGVIRTLEQPVLGICLGLQLLFQSSAEGDVECLGIVPGQVTRLPSGPEIRLLHMGWNQFQWHTDDPLSRGLASDAWFYFVHGYAAPADRAVAVASHGRDFGAVVRKDNFVACQFHPEKSGGAGARLLANFLEPRASSAQPEILSGGAA